MTYQSPIGRVRFDEVVEISQTVQLGRAGGDFELSVPLHVIGFDPGGAEVQGDLGLLRGNGSQTTLRVYWNNLDTNLTSDLPSEARLQPANWGIWRIR